MTDYLFDQTPEARRLAALGDLLDPDTIDHLTRLGVAPGWQCLEVGAGSGSIARWMAARVGKTGAVVATDINPRGLDRLAAEGIEVRAHDIAADPLEERRFDLIHARAVLQHVPGRGVALARMIRALRPGGTLLIEDIVSPHPASHPDLPIWRRILDGIEQQLRRAGADPYYGLELHGTLEAAGLRGVRCEARVAMMYSGTPSIEFVTLSVEQLGDRLVAAGVLTAAELAEAVATLRAPGYTMTSAIMIAASGSAPT